MFPTIEIGRLSLPVPGLLVLVTVWLGLSIAERWASRYRVPGSKIYYLLFYSLLAGLIGARISFLASTPRAFFNDPLSLFALDQHLFDPLGGLLIAGLVGWFYASQENLPLLDTLDAVTPFLAVIQIGLSASQLASGAGYGSPTSLPWGIYLWGAARHPTQIYQMLIGAGILAMIWAWNPAGEDDSGKVFFTFLALSSGGRLVTEAFRGDSDYILGGIRTAQIYSWALLAFSLWYLGNLMKSKEE